MPGMAPRTGLEGPMDLTMDDEVAEREHCAKCGGAMLPDEMVITAGGPVCFMCAEEEPMDDMEDPRDPDRAYDAKKNGDFMDQGSLDQGRTKRKSPKDAEFCKDCGAMPDEPHLEGCPGAYMMDPPSQFFGGASGSVPHLPIQHQPYEEMYDEGLDESKGEEPIVEFDKFMDRIVVDERHQKKVDPRAENNPQRQRAARYQDRPMNKTRWGGR